MQAAAPPPTTRRPAAGDSTRQGRAPRTRPCCACGRPCPSPSCGRGGEGATAQGSLASVGRAPAGPADPWPPPATPTGRPAAAAPGRPVQPEIRLRARSTLSASMPSAPEAGQPFDQACFDRDCAPRACPGGGRPQSPRGTPAASAAARSSAPQPPASSSTPPPSPGGRGSRLPRSARSRGGALAARRNARVRWGPAAAGVVQVRGAVGGRRRLTRLKVRLVACATFHRSDSCPTRYMLARPSCMRVGKGVGAVSCRPRACASRGPSQGSQGTTARLACCGGAPPRAPRAAAPRAAPPAAAAPPLAGPSTPPCSRGTHSGCRCRQ
jgi:hypothetical protein